jgi:hypothetical protein
MEMQFVVRDRDYNDNDESTSFYSYKSVDKYCIYSPAARELEELYYDT